MAGSERVQVGAALDQEQAFARAKPVERVHSGLRLQLLYSLEDKVPGLRRVPIPVRRATRRALTAAAVRISLRSCRATRMAAVTGSMGKTTTKDLLGAMLAAAGSTMVTRSNDNGVYGVPATLLLVRPSDDFAVIEFGARERGDMEWMASFLRPEVAVLTGIALDHIGSLGTVEAVIEEKRALLSRLGEEGTAVVNADDKRARAVTEDLPCRTVTAGHSLDADVRVVSTRLDWPRGIVVELVTEGERHVVHTRLLGEHRGPQVAMALAAARTMGIETADAIAAAEQVPTRPGRLSPAAGPAGSVLLLDDLQARPATVSAALETLAEVPADRRIAVLGELQDDDSRRAYEQVAAAASRVAELIVAVGRSGPALRPALDGRVELLAAERPSEVASLLLPRLGEGDAVLVCGATRQHTIRVALRLTGEDAACDVARCTLEWSCTDCPYLPVGAPESRIEVR